ncbi:siphovirus Gp157 family protein [Tetragenococcus halophilus]|uniref:Siphovirus Gp157 family protein n=1 Tax=Tetragenococcus halophilus (strain DSM 20338 / JCM 20259 / NCIMB 9735 / NBRC 12172) TaxID=945021 RepID=A0AAN1SHT8_TETHN|nr:siphovirus Gp157 family protein [Tetragenococcus halophilus]BAK95167.1 hypothetical protein TEH_18400 [Tetragenococcus halophilus NBRC 12172]GBD71087.1 putative uncharacterized protein [Tetragenococcus halophilus subsp. halophilus]
MTTLYELTGNYKQLIELAEENDVGAIKDTLDSLNEAIDDKVENTAKVIRELESRRDARKKEAQRLNEGATSLDKQVANLKNYLQEQLKAVDRNKVQGEFLTVAVQNNPASVHVEDETKIPRDYFTEQEPKLDKTRIKNELKNGLEINGAELKQSQRLTIK